MQCTSERPPIGSSIPIRLHEDHSDDRDHAGAGAITIAAHGATEPRGAQQ